MGPLLIMFGVSPLLDCIKKEDSPFAACIASLLGCDRESDLHFRRFYTLSRNYNAMVRTRLIWGPYYLYLTEDLWLLVLRNWMLALQFA
jgi:hypothetical protein